MIGIVGNDKFFEFREDKDLIFAFDKFGSGFRANTVLILTRANKLRAVIRFDNFDFKPDLEPEERYRVVGINSDEDDIFFKNMTIEVDKYDPRFLFNYPFVFIEQRYPKTLDIY